MNGWQEKRPRIGFWSSLRLLPLKSYIWELATAILIGVPGAGYLLTDGTVNNRVDVASDYVLVAAPLLGLVFAAFILVVALFSDSYIETLIQYDANGVLQSDSNRILIFLRPFIVAIGFQLAAVVTCVAYRAVACIAPTEVEVTLFFFCTVLFLFAIFDVLAVTRTVAMHGLTRALSIEVAPLEANDSKPRNP